jgi:hypothetical protein
LHVRKLIMFLAVLAALAGTAGAAQAAKVVPPSVICGMSCDGGGTPGWTGCTEQTASHSDGFPYLASYRHYLVVSYCKRNGVITSASIAAHGCDTSGVIICSAGPAWQTGGGVGYGYATFTGHASVISEFAGVPIYQTDVVDLTVALG